MDQHSCSKCGAPATYMTPLTGSGESSRFFSVRPVRNDGPTSGERIWSVSSVSTVRLVSVSISRLCPFIGHG
jgi:hypothetical protein